MAEQQGVSIVICCYNASMRIARTLQHLQQQQFAQYIPWEVIVIDNASTDNTSMVASTEWKKHPVTSFNLCKESKPGLNHARNRGIKEAQYEIISFVDDDNWVEKFWVEKVHSIFYTYDNVGACAGQNIPVFETNPPTWFPLFTHSYACGKLHFNEGIVNHSIHGNLWGAGLSIRKDILVHLKEINFNFITTDRKGDSLSCGGDTELCYAVRLLGYDLYYTNKLILKHYIPNVRLEWGYLKKLNFEFGRLHAKVQPYYSLYHNKPLKPWYIYARNAIVLYLRYQLQRTFTKDQKQKWKCEIKASLWKGRLIQLLQDKGKDYKPIYNRLKKMLSSPLQKRVIQEISH